MKNIDKNIIEKAINGDENSLEELIEAVIPDIRAFVTSRCRGYQREYVDDIVQETLIRIFINIKKLKEPNLFQNWVIKIALSRIQTHFKPKQLHICYGEFDNEKAENIDNTKEERNTHNYTREEILEKLYKKQTIERIIDKLKTFPKQRRIATLAFFINGLSHKEIAKKMKITEGAVKYHVFFGKENLKQIFGIEENIEIF